MSNALAVAAVTTTLRARLFASLGGPQVTVVPPDRAPLATNGDHVNLFLYRADLHPSFRNADPQGTRPGETPRPLLPLVLHYLLASYSNDETTAQQLLGASMLALHERPFLGADEIRAATSTPLADSDLYLQLEQVKIIHESLTQDDIAKLWTAFGTPFRMSASYQVSVVQIDAALPGRAPLPVLTRGADGRSPEVLPDASPPFPALTGVRYPAPGLVAARPGEQVRLLVANLPTTALAARLRHLRVPRAVTVALPAPPGGASEVALTLPGAGLPAGPWAVGLGPPAGAPLLTNEVALAVTPQVTALKTAAAAGGRTTVTVTLAQPVLAGQQAAVLLGGRQFAVKLLKADTSTPAVTALLARGTYKVRMRVDGVDSEIVDRATGAYQTGPTAEVVVP